MNMSFALLNEKLVHVDEVANGLSCGCVCPQCGENLIAKNRGKVKEHHFAHYSTSECAHGSETMLHLLEKNVEKVEGVISKINSKDDSIEKFNTDTVKSYNVFELWQMNENKPFLARNIKSGIAVFFIKDPIIQYNKYRKCYGQMYKNGYKIGSRVIYGVFDDQWILIPKEQ